MADLTKEKFDTNYKTFYELRNDFMIKDIENRFSVLEMVYTKYKTMFQYAKDCLSPYNADPDFQNYAHKITNKIYPNEKLAASMIINGSLGDAYSALIKIEEAYYEFSDSKRYTFEISNYSNEDEQLIAIKDLYTALTNYTNRYIETDIKNFDDAIDYVFGRVYRYNIVLSENKNNEIIFSNEIDEKLEDEIRDRFIN